MVRFLVSGVFVILVLVLISNDCGVFALVFVFVIHAIQAAILVIVVALVQQ